MKTTLLVAFIVVSMSRPAIAALVVHDPLNQVVMIENSIAEIAKLLTLIQELQTTKDWLGHAEEVKDLLGAQETVTGLQKPSQARTRPDIVANSTSTDATSYDGHGLYTPVGDSFRTRDGRLVQRGDQFKPEAAIFVAVSDHDTVYEDVAARREQIRTSISKSLSQLQGAKTHAEVLKVSGLLTGQLAELEATDHELLFSAQKAQMLDIENRADQERQKKAVQEELAQEFSEGLVKLGNILEVPDFRRSSSR